MCEVCIEHSCVDTCYTDALLMSGRSISVDELFAIIQRDRQYWGSQGGITLSGGEPLLQLDFAHAILKKSHDAYIHTAIETCGNVAWQHFEKTINYLDWIFFDIKHADIVQHKVATGIGNENIVNNIQMLNEYYKGDLVFRLPLIPGFNDSEKNLKSIAAIISDTKWKIIKVLP